MLRFKVHSLGLLICGVGPGTYHQDRVFCGQDLAYGGSCKGHSYSFALKYLQYVSGLWVLDTSIERQTDKTAQMMLMIDKTEYYDKSRAEKKLVRIEPVLL